MTNSADLDQLASSLIWIYTFNAGYIRVQMDKG